MRFGHQLPFLTTRLPESNVASSAPAHSTGPLSQWGASLPVTCMCLVAPMTALFTLIIPKLPSCCSCAVSAEQQLRNLRMIRAKRGEEPTPASDQKSVPLTPQNCAAPCLHAQSGHAAVSHKQGSPDFKLPLLHRSNSPLGLMDKASDF